MDVDGDKVLRTLSSFPQTVRQVSGTTNDRLPQSHRAPIPNHITLKVPYPLGVTKSKGLEGIILVYFKIMENPQ
jgi:hypothetical protein